ncbi:disulfide bond formation protein DsbB [Shewanella loihica]|uniref:Disulfide bond formation protein B n=1 Tax=Shewanella loihica (strain ATCC BAA-1088 / PV-4) TaxID=323850 RepID=DSBB_SHELP|nr:MULTISPECIES: disulfide bond formation protein DsbB [Shewanella]A3QEZ4.1 RecName: Full=Disulfide bond formation protein B; AltName: Full=Disulfide oxidoreductase [Shewanella loihica PV-4]ABO24042.1 Disulphide bond formation protein DsbB [Shewanella loihica PV-4]QYJ80887.1 disulfide bond formation protein DsbB [Shewanella aegiceratis]QYJ96121.1 disulfide bond formation protein DsbB [Shewanella alkalitolerans]QYK11378.1 disulfide bond formation protein DsbB [Shewanella rhizosphaerae]TVP12783
MSALTRFAQSRLAWTLLLLTAVGLEACALFFQHVMKLDPCVMCIYQRLAVLGVLTAGLIGVVGHQFRLLRFLGVLLWGVSAAWGLKLALELVEMQTNPSPFSTCSFLPEFPEWMPLHEWFPSVFLPTGMCTDIPWEMFGITMSQWMVVAFSTYLIALVVFIVPALMPTKKA